MHGPPIVDENVENGQEEDEEGGGPLCLEANDDERDGKKTNDGERNANQRPLALDDEAEEEENKEDSACQLKVLALVSL